MSLGQNIRRFRRDKGWTQAQLAGRTGIKMGHISRVEQDDGDPKLSTLYKLMQAFSCSPDSLMMDTARVNADAVLKQTLERATALPEVYKRIIIDVVDKVLHCVQHTTDVPATGPPMALRRNQACYPGPGRTADPARESAENPGKDLLSLTHVTLPYPRHQVM